jgi:cyclophilin family peptidyl-prolyl cis-trans isomerase
MHIKTIVAAVVGLFFAVPVVAQAPAVDPENILLLDLSTGGRVAIQLRPDLAPNHVARIKTLTRQRFYDGTKFHRVIEGFMAQVGDPTGTGEGGSQLPDLVAEFNPMPHLRGVVSMARTSEPNTANSQFFIMFTPRLTLDGKYTVFGRVMSGMEYVDAIERGEPPANPSRIVQASIAADNVPPPPPGAPIPIPAAETAARPPAAPAIAAPGAATAAPAQPSPAPAADPAAAAPAESTAAPPAEAPAAPAEAAPAPAADPAPSEPAPAEPPQTPEPAPQP